MGTDGIISKTRSLSRKDRPRGKVLRIGIIQGPRIVEERLIRSGRSVTVGEAADNMFVLPASHLPDHHRLFVARADGYHLAFDRKMQGKVFIDGTVQTLERLAGATPQRRGVHHLKLADGNRGKVRIGGTTVLFQFVPAPPEPRRVAVSFSPMNMGEVDWVFWSFVVLSTVLNIAGYTYLQSRPAPPPHLGLDDIPERFAEIWLPEEVVDEMLQIDPDAEDPIDEPTLDIPTPTDDPATAEADDPGEPGPGEDDALADGGEQLSAEELRAQRMEQLRSMGLAAALIPTNSDNNNGTATLDLMADSGTLEANLDEAIGRSNGFRNATVADARESTRHTGGGDGTAGTIGEHGGFGAGETGTTDRDQAAVTAIIEPEDPFVDPGVDHGSVAAVLSRHAGEVQHIYERHLKDEPELAGKVELTVLVGVDGKVIEVTTSANSTGNRDLGLDLCRRVKRWSFPATGEEYEAVFPINLFPG